MGPPYIIKLTVRQEAHQHVLNEKWRAQFGGDDLIWTKARIAQTIRMVNLGQIETLAHLRGRISSIGEWNRELPAFAEGAGCVLIADHEGTVTPVDLVGLRRKAHFLERYREFFDEITGLEDAYMLMGGRGSPAGIAANESPIPSAPRSAIYRDCVRHGRLDLWFDFHTYREHPDIKSWTALRSKSVPWAQGRTVEDLVEIHSRSWSVRSNTLPSELDVRRALTPQDTPSNEPDELPPCSADPTEPTPPFSPEP